MRLSLLALAIGVQLSQAWVQLSTNSMFDFADLAYDRQPFAPVRAEMDFLTRTRSLCGHAAHAPCSETHMAASTTLTRYKPPSPQVPQRPAWSQSPQDYSFQMRLPDLEPASVTASLAAGSEPTVLQITGTRKIESCTCTPTIQKEITLPYRPRAEDIQVEYDQGVLSVTLERHAKADAPIAVPVKSAKPKYPPKASADAEKVEPPQTTMTLADQERSALEKFRSAAAAVAAITAGSRDSGEAHGHPEQPSSQIADNAEHQPE
jgi:HSP20 family molecular chaperone IbpA